jgi:hypothetical protein
MVNKLLTILFLGLFMISLVSAVDKKDLIWIDLNDVAESVEDELEDFLKIFRVKEIK